MSTALTKGLLASSPTDAKQEYAAWLRLLETNLSKPHDEASLLHQLRSRLDDGQTIEAIYIESQIPTQQHRNLYDHRGWQSAQFFAVGRRTKNKDILDALDDGLGVLGLDFTNSKEEPPPLADMLRSVLVPIIPFSLLAPQWNHIDSLWGYLRQHDIPKDYISYLNLPIAMADKHLADVLAQTKGFPNIRVLGVSGLVWHNAGASDAQELAAICGEIVASLHAAQRLGLAPNAILPRLNLQISVGTNFLVALAKLRALRLLWAQLCAPLEYTSLPHIEVHISQRSHSTGDIWINVLRTTSAALAAGIAGCNVMVLPSHNAPTGQTDAQAMALARHTQTLLQDESHIGEVGDAAAGSWFFEALSTQLAQTAWSLFQTIERKGGIIRAHNWLKTSCQKHFATIQDAAETGEQALLGVNCFIDLTTHMPTPASPSATKRLAQNFEALRRRISAIKPASNRPQITLAQQTTQLEPLMGWARNAFAAGGIACAAQIMAEAITTKPSSAPTKLLGLVCDTPPTTPSLKQWRKAGFTHIYLLGRKALDLSQTVAPHIAGQLVQGANLSDFLHHVHQQLGLDKPRQTK